VLSELGLSKELGVSRTPVREAIRRLEQEDILEECGKGMVVVGITPEDMKDMFEIRLAVEGEAARRAAQLITDDRLHALREILDLQRFYSEKGGENSSDQIKNMDSQFHEIVYSACGSRPYIRTLLPLHKRMMKLRKASVSKHSRAMQSLEEHEAIYEALRKHDPDAAEEAVLTHTRNARERMTNLGT
jgi:DNA-binding GntR family transcriptional regulator